MGEAMSDLTAVMAKCLDTPRRQVPVSDEQRLERRRQRAREAAWNPEDHPRDEDGEFTSGGGRAEGSTGLHGFTVERVSVDFTAGARVNQQVSNRQSKKYGSEFQPCQVCGRHVDKAKAQYLEFDNAMNVIVGDENPKDSSGGFPVGPDCLKQMPDKVQQWAKTMKKGVGK